MPEIAHIDADAFFASVEQAADRRLRGCPVAVGGGSRGVIASASYEARAYGIHSAMPVFRAKQRCPGLLLVQGHYELYEQFSDSIFDLCTDCTPFVEPASIDEAYLDFRGSLKDRSARMRQLRSLGREINGWLKITVSQGVASNKRVAQIASKVRKPHAFIVIPPGSERRFLAPLPIRHLPGLGPKSCERLGALGIENITDLLKAGPDGVSHILGKATPDILEAAAGIDNRPVREVAPKAKSYGEQVTFDQDAGSESWIERMLKQILTRLLVQLRKAGERARTISVTLRYTDHEESMASHSLREPSNLEIDFFPQVRPLMKRAWARRVRLRLVRVQLSRLYPAMIQEDLFSSRHSRARQLAAAADHVNAHWGKGVLKPACLM